jgi:hypothetical protein
MPVRIVRIPIIVKRTKNDDINLLGGALGCAFLKILGSDENLEALCDV